MSANVKIWFTDADTSKLAWNEGHTCITVVHGLNCYPLIGVWDSNAEQIFPTVTCLDGNTVKLDFGRETHILADKPWCLTVSYGSPYGSGDSEEGGGGEDTTPGINPMTGGEYYSGHWKDVIKFCKALNIDEGRLSAVKPINVENYQAQVDGIIDGYFSESYFLPITKCNQVGVDGIVRLIFPQRLRYLAQQMVAGLLMLSEFQHQEQNMNEAGSKMFEEAKKEIYQMTLWNHRIPGQRYKSRTSKTMPPGYEPGHELIEQIWSMN